MTVAPEISLAIIQREIADCNECVERYEWKFSAIDEDNQKFLVEMISPIDGQRYILDIKFDTYREFPLLIDFVDPATGQVGVKTAYPQSDDGFFHDHPCICNPCSRKAYGEYKGPHGDWEKSGWEKNPKVGTLTNVCSILWAVYNRISRSELYKGRKK